jgi:hypothetical protein
MCGQGHQGDWQSTGEKGPLDQPFSSPVAPSISEQKVP